MKKSFKVLEDIAAKKKLPKNDNDDSIEPLLDDYNKQVKKDAKSLADKVRNFVKAQVDDWKKLPYLANEVDGRNGYCEHFSRIYTHGYYQISTTAAFSNLHIDCDNGEIVSIILGRHAGKIADDDEILHMATDLEVVNAKIIVDTFEKEAVKPISDYHDKEKNQAEREHRRELFKLKPLYSRKKR